VLLSVDSFIKEDERLELLCVAHYASKDDWSINTGGGEYWIGNRYPFESKIFDKLNNRIKLYFFEYQTISPFCSIQRIEAGAGMGEHSDNYNKTCNFGCVVYLNDNFDGGELVYPKLNKTIKPIAGRLIVHSSEEPHLVNTVLNGTRYFLSSFIYGDETKTAKLVNNE